MLLNDKNMDNDFSTKVKQWLNNTDHVERTTWSCDPCGHNKVTVVARIKKTIVSCNECEGEYRFSHAHIISLDTDRDENAVSDAVLEINSYLVDKIKDDSFLLS